MKAPLFPRETTPWHTLEVSPGRSLTLSTVAMAVLTGVLLRAFRAFALVHRAAPDTSVGWLYLSVTFGVGALLLFGMLTLHLANYPVRRWPWRVAAFTLVETAAEMAISAVLIATDREPLGTSGRAHWHDLPTMTATTLGVRVLALGIFTLVLAIIVQLVRVMLGRRGPRATLHAHAAPRDS